MDERNEQEMLRKYANHGMPVDPSDLQNGVMYIVENADNHLLRVLTFNEEAYHQMDLGTLETQDQIMYDYAPRYIPRALEMFREGPEGAFFVELDEPVAFRDLEWDEPYQIVVPQFYEYQQSKDAYETEHEQRKRVLSRSKGLFPVSEEILKYLLKPKKSAKKNGKNKKSVRKNRKSVKSTKKNRKSVRKNKKSKKSI